MSSDVDKITRPAFLPSEVNKEARQKTHTLEQLHVLPASKSASLAIPSARVYQSSLSSIALQEMLRPVQASSI